MNLLYRHYNTYFPCVAKWREKKRIQAPVVEKVTSDPEAIDNKQRPSLSTQPSNVGSYSQASKLALNKRANELLRRADTTLTQPEEDSNAQLYGSSDGGAYSNYVASSGSGNYASRSANYSGSVGGQSSYSAYSAGGSRGVGSSANAMQHSAVYANAMVAIANNSNTPNRSKTSPQNNHNARPPAYEKVDFDDDYETRQSSVRDSSTEEGHYEDPDKPHDFATAAGNYGPDSKQRFISAAGTARDSNAGSSKRELEDDYVEPDSLRKSHARPSADRLGGINSLHAAPPLPPAPPPSSPQAVVSSAKSRAALSLNSPNASDSTNVLDVDRAPVPHTRDSSMDKEYLDMVHLGPAPHPPTQSQQKIK